MVFGKEDDMINLAAEEWKCLSNQDRAVWDEEARNDKVRYVSEKLRVPPYFQLI